MVVVIAILAAITIVAYNGIATKAKASAAVSTASQATKKLALYAVQNNDSYPVSSSLSDATNFLSSTGLSQGDGITTGPNYQYTSPYPYTTYTTGMSLAPSFCLTTTTSSISYYTTNTSLTPTAGACAGQGVNGQQAITNLAFDPRATVVGGAYSVNRIFGWSPFWFGTGGAGTTTAVTGAGDGPVGITTYLRKTWTTAGPAGTTGFAHTAGHGSNSSNAYPVTAGQQFAFSSYLRASVSGLNFLGRVEWHRADGTWYQDYGPTYTSVANTWQRLARIVTVPSDAIYGVFTSDVNPGTTTSWQVGNTLDGTGLMVVQSSTLNNYTDPLTNPSSWAWTGTPNASTSIGTAS